MLNGPVDPSGHGKYGVTPTDAIFLVFLGVVIVVCWVGQMPTLKAGKPRFPRRLAKPGWHGLPKPARIGLRGCPDKEYLNNGHRPLVYPPLQREALFDSLRNRDLIRASLKVIFDATGSGFNAG